MQTDEYQIREMEEARRLADTDALRAEVGRLRAEMKNLIAELDDAERIARLERAKRHAPPGDEEQRAHYLAGWYAGWNDALQHL